jgi:hypothetical protein
MDNRRTARGQPEDTLEQSKQINNNSIATEVAGVNDLFKIFHDTVNPMIRYQNTTERKASEALIKKLGLEKTITAAKFAVSIQGTKYAPTITKPTQLLNKYGELQAYYTKNIKQTEVAKI